MPVESDSLAEYLIKTPEKSDSKQLINEGGGNRDIDILEIFSEYVCRRPGCTNTFPPDKRVPHKIFCSEFCYNDLRLARKRLLHWYELTGCVFALAQFLFLGGQYRSSA